MEHMAVSDLTEKRFKNIENSAVSDHLLQCNCTIDFDHFDIFDTGVRRFNLLVEDYLLIKTIQP